MTFEEALALLGLSQRPDDEALRFAYLAAVRAVHPDLYAGSDATHRTVQVNLAYELLTTATDPTVRHTFTPAPPRAPRASTPRGVTRFVLTPAHDTMWVSASPDQVAALLIDVGNDIGDVTFFDPAAGLMQIVVEFVDEPVSYLVLALAPKKRGTQTVVTASIEAIEDRPAPALAAVTGLLSSMLTDALESLAS